MCEEFITVSSLGKTWILDLDGTLVKHNGYKLDGHDTLLPGVEDFFKHINPKDMVIIVTSRNEETKEATIRFLMDKQIRYDHIIWSAPYGERILINDIKPSGLKTAIAVNTFRDTAPSTRFKVDQTL